jgi:hypothetical protein
MYGWFTGAGAISVSATALDTSAAALTAAAAKLAGGSLTSDVLKGGTAGKAGSSIWGKIGTAGLATLPYLGPLAIGTGAYKIAEDANEASVSAVLGPPSG